MALSETKCPNCGANIVADSGKKKISCIYCHTEFTLTPDTVSHSGGTAPGAEVTDIFERAEVFLTSLRKPDEALKLYSDYSMKEPGDYRGWLGIARALSNDFTKTECDSETLSKIEDNILSAMRVAGDDADDIKKTWEEYRNRVTVPTYDKNSSESDVDELEKTVYKSKTNYDRSGAPVFVSSAEIQNLAERSRQLGEEIEVSKAKLEEKQAKYKPPSTKKKVAWGALSVVYGSGLLFFHADNKKRKEIEDLEKSILSLTAEKEEVDKRYNELTSHK